MRLVADTNPAIAALITQGVSQELFVLDHLSILVPDWFWFELGKHWDDVSAKTGLTEENLAGALHVLRDETTTRSLKEYEHELDNARHVAPEAKDAEFFALALANDCPIWSDDKGSNKQDVVDVYDTTELYERFLTE